MGTLLVFGMLLAPGQRGGAARPPDRGDDGRRGGHRAISSYAGLLLSYCFDIAAGATIVLVAVVIFFVVLAACVTRAGRRDARAPDEAPA